MPPGAFKLLAIATQLDPTIASDQRRRAFGLPLTRGEMADFLGLTIETVSRQLSRLRKDGIIDIEQVRRLPENLALREARRHLSTVTQLQTRPRQRLPYARFLGWDEAQATLKAYIGHPEGETRGHALAILLALAGHTRDDAQRAARVEEALRMVRARKNEQDPVRAAMLQALVDWPRAAWSARNLPDVAQILRDALDAADLSHGTAQLAERLVVRLFRLDGEWGAKWFATLVKERGTIYAPRLGDQLTDSDVRALGTTLLDVARAWATREREAQLVQLAASLKGRLTWVAGLMDLLERVVRDSATAATSLALMALIEHDDRPRFDAMIGDVCRNWLARRWESSLINLTQGLRRGTVPAPLAAAMEEALRQLADESKNLAKAAPPPAKPVAPVIPPPSAGPRPPGAGRTQALDSGGMNSTVYVPGPPAGMTMSPQAMAIRQHVLAPKPVAQKNPKPLFWIGWALLGICLGMLLHIIWN